MNFWEIVAVLVLAGVTATISYFLDKLKKM